MLTFRCLPIVWFSCSYFLNTFTCSIYIKKLCFFFCFFYFWSCAYFNWLLNFKHQYSHLCVFACLLQQRAAEGYSPLQVAVQGLDGCTCTTAASPGSLLCIDRWRLFPPAPWWRNKLQNFLKLLCTFGDQQTTTLSQNRSIRSVIWSRFAVEFKQSEE